MDVCTAYNLADKIVSLTFTYMKLGPSKIYCKLHFSFTSVLSQQVFTCPKSTMETPEKRVKYVQI